MFLDKLFHSIGSFFKNLFTQAAETYDKLEPAIQSALVWGSGVVSVLNNFTGGVVIDLIKEKFPDLPVDKLKDALVKISSTLGIADTIVADDLETTVSNLQKYLSSLSGTEWAYASDTIAKGIAAFTAPEGTKYSIISSLIESVYQRYFKKDKIAK